MFSRRGFCSSLVVAVAGGFAMTLTACSNGADTSSSTTPSIRLLDGVDVQVHRDPG